MFTHAFSHLEISNSSWLVWPQGATTRTNWRIAWQFTGGSGEAIFLAVVAWRDITDAGSFLALVFQECEAASNSCRKVTALVAQLWANPVEVIPTEK
jgi:hypothetical protein